MPTRVFFYKERKKDLDFDVVAQDRRFLDVLRGRHNEASFRRKLDLIKKNVGRKENPLELLFKDVSNFGAQNPVIGSLLREIDLRKTDTLSNFFKKGT